jgi:cytochrome c553
VQAEPTSSAAGASATPRDVARRVHVMRAVAGRLTDEEIKAVAEYLAGLQ